MLYQQLQQCNELLTGSAAYLSSEQDFTFTAEYNNMGHVTINGSFTEHKAGENTLHFEFPTDQSFIQTTLSQLNKLFRKYGNMQGIVGT
ncbi:MAG: hypothetical protein JWP58_2870 [Hymenobacter sp.]|nr:hypothetical protein [Hymenobacter sp.]